MTWLIILMVVVYCIKIYYSYMTEQKKQAQRKAEAFGAEQQKRKMQEICRVPEAQVMPEVYTVPETQAIPEANIETYTEEYVETEVYTEHEAPIAPEAYTEVYAKAYTEANALKLAENKSAPLAYETKCSIVSSEHLLVRNEEMEEANAGAEQEIPYIGQFSPEAALVYDAIMNPKSEI